MLSPAAPPAPATGDFETTVEAAIRGFRGTHTTRTYAHDHGIDEQALVNYATGACTVYERREIENVLARCHWALDFVVKWVKQQRKEQQRQAA